jgi:hypothetical protein
MKARNLLLLLGCAALLQPACTCDSEHSTADDQGIGSGLGTDESGDSSWSGGGGDEKFDIAEGGSGGGAGDCDEDGNPDDEYDFSVIWISNSTEGTVSKIDTVTATELARYRTGPGAPDPSRTSVNLLGDVAVANRAGSVTKIAAKEEHCVDADGDGTIRTSQGPDDVLAWGEDECVLWHHDIDFPEGLTANTGGPRGIAWDGGRPGEDPCHPHPRVWVGWRAQPDTKVIVRRLDGDTGEVDAEVEVTGWQGNWDHGTYGGAANREGDFWGLGTLGTLIKVDAETIEVERFDIPSAHVLYGIALDAEGTPWLGGWEGHIWRFDPELDQWQDMGAAGGPTRLRGLAVDEEGHAWLAGNAPCALVQYDTLGEELINGNIELPGCSEPVGVSIDVEGSVWVVDRGANVAFKVQPDSYTVETVEGLVGPYTYSDMTGAGLGLVVNPPQG